MCSKARCAATAITCASTLQLIDGKTDNHIWSKDYDRTLNDALTLQTEVASAVADQLSVTVFQAARNAAPPTKSIKAYDLYLKAELAVQDLNFAQPEAAFRAVDDLAKQALALDPDFALAHQLRSDICSSLFIFNLDISPQNVATWRSELNAAAELAPEDPSILAARGTYAWRIDRDLPGALRWFDQVEAKGLIAPVALVGKSEVLLAMGRVDEAIAVAKRIFAADPQNFDVAVAPVLSSLAGPPPPGAVSRAHNRAQPGHAAAQYGEVLFHRRYEPVIPSVQSIAVRRAAKRAVAGFHG